MSTASPKQPSHQRNTCDDLDVCPGTRRCLGCQWCRYPFAPGVIERGDAVQDFAEGTCDDSLSLLTWNLLAVLAVLELLAVVFFLSDKLLLP